MLNEAAAIASTLDALRRGAPDAEIVVVDGGSADASVAIARPLCDALIVAPRGRAHQMNAGARAAHGDALAFVHADTIVPATFAADIASALSDPAVVGGRFDVQLDASSLPYRIIGAMISLRSRISRTGTGDQAIFVRRGVFDRLAGFPDLELCEDLEFSRRLKRAGRVACLRSPRDHVGAAMDSRRRRAHRRPDVADSRDVPDGRAAGPPQTNLRRHALAD